jgi:hypothetical protein
MLRTACAALVATFFAASSAHADTICEWTDFSGRVGKAAMPPPKPGVPPAPDHARYYSQVALAMFEAVNSIDRRYESYLKLPVADRAASQDAAAATAAYTVLLSHFPAQKATLDDNYAIAMEAVADAAAREAGRGVGETAARAALAAGRIDPAVRQTPFRPRTTPGVLTATQLPVIEPWAVTFKPWFLPSLDAVRPAPPPALTSERWARDFDEVKRLGARDSAARTPHQTLMARYRITPDMTPSLRGIADAPGRSLVRNARLFALMEMVADDAGSANAAAKLHYAFWRPISAIRNAADDGNPATAPDPGWAPLINTPNHPEYPCGHCTYARAAASVLTAEVGASPPGGVRVSSASIPDSLVQVLPSYDAWVRDVSLSRILGGVHYRFSNEAGEEIGRRVAALALAGHMRPLAGGGAAAGAE